MAKKKVDKRLLIESIDEDNELLKKSIQGEENTKQREKVSRRIFDAVDRAQTKKGKKGPVKGRKDPTTKEVLERGDKIPPGPIRKPDSTRAEQNRALSRPFPSIHLSDAKAAVEKKVRVMDKLKRIGDEKRRERAADDVIGPAGIRKKSDKGTSLQEIGEDIKKGVKEMNPFRGLEMSKDELKKNAHEFIERGLTGPEDASKAAAKIKAKAKLRNKSKKKPRSE